MPSLLRIGPYRFFFYSNEKGEPPHIHVQREAFLAKFWLTPVVLAKSRHFSSHVLRAMQRIVEKHRTLFPEKWDAHFDD